MKSWLNQQTQIIKLVLGRFKKNASSTLLICLAIGITLALPSLLYIALNSFASFANTVKSDTQLSVFLSPDISEDAKNSIKTDLEENREVSYFNFVSKEDALAKLTDSNNKDALASLENNPLPDAYFVGPAKLDAESVNALKTSISKLAGVDEVIVDDAWIKRLNYVLSIGQKALFLLSCLLGLALLAVIGNTVRMQILTQQAEIELSRLIGATKSFIRRPFLYAGALYGLLGGLFALGITSIVLFLLNRTIAPLAAEYQSDFALHYPNFSICFIVCAIAILIGLLSSYFAVTKSLFSSK
jgi:cell division transport system permease protein